MGDRETGSEWSHILGEALAGKMKGTTLEIIPSVMTNWGAWLSEHPDTTATMISKTATEFTTEMIREHPEGFGLGLVHDGKARFWRFDRLAAVPVVNDRAQDLEMVVYYDASKHTPYAWERTISVDASADASVATPMVLEFVATDTGVRDKQTDSLWDLKRGLATSGKLKGQQLRPVPAIVSYTAAWERFHPESANWKLEP